MSEPFIGEIKMFAGTFAPRDWAFCDGRLISISENQALFSILGASFGGDGRATFGLPDLRGRVPMSPGRHPGSNSDYRLGQTGGQESMVLTANQMPAHTHAGAAHTHPMPNHTHTPNANSSADSDSPTSNYWASVSSGDEVFSGSTDATMNANAIAPGGEGPTGQGGDGDQSGRTGGGAAFSNIQPYAVVQFIIALQGIYPSRS